MNAMEMLRMNSVFWSKLGFCYDPPRLGKDGKPIVFFDNWDQVKKYHADFYRAGIKLHTSILFNGWTGVDRYDYELTDRVLEAVFSCGGEDLLYIPRIKLNVPLEWSEANPEELCVYYDGPRDAESIRALVGMDKHDFLGYPSAKGYYTAGGWQDDRPNVGGLISNQSFSSKKWLRDAGEVLRRIIRRIEDGPYGKRIPAWHIAYGVSGESCVWGRCNIFNSADYGVTNRKMFYDWGIKKYGSPEALRKAWRQPGLTRDTVELPSPDHKEGPIRGMNEFFRAAPEDVICTDYDLFVTDVNVDALEHFGRIAKRESGGKPVGAFYGYFLQVARSTYTGYNGMERVLCSPYIDFLAAPKREGGGEMCPAQSVNRRKLWMDELDNRTCMAKGTGLEYKSSDFEETKSILWREFAKNVSHGSSFWWMDLGGGWYDSPVLLSEIARIEKSAAQFRNRKMESVSEVCLVVDEETFHYHKTSYYLHRCLFPELIDAMNRVGAPYDFYRMKDLETLDLSRYKILVFANPFRADAAQWEKIEVRIPETTLSIWYYAPGILQDGISSAENIQTFLGCAVKERTPDFAEKMPTCGMLEGTVPLQWPPHVADDACPVADNCPVFEIYGDGLRPAARYADGAAAAAELKIRGHRHLFSAVPLLKEAHFRKLMQQEGCRLIAPEGVLVYAASRFVALFAWRPCSFTLRLPGKAVWFEAVKEENVSSEVFLNLRADEARIYIQK